MNIWAIGDLHMDNSGEKPMDIFGPKWINHEEKIFEFWKENIKEDDLILLPGDISWALHLEDVTHDLDKIEKLKGRKIISKGNHDYWWASNNKLKGLGYKTIEFINNNSLNWKDISICGTRGWIDKSSREFQSKDLKIFNRELLRMENSFKYRTGEKIIAMVHYPPFNADKELNEMGKLIVKYKPFICIYGHLHGEGHSEVVEGKFEETQFICVSSDFIDFKAVKIWSEN